MDAHGVGNRTAPLALIVNAGGKSRRMGREKALLPMPERATPRHDAAHSAHHEPSSRTDNERRRSITGSTLLAHIIHRLQPVVEGETIVVANRSDLARRAAVETPVSIIADRWPAAGALGGLATGLSLVRARSNCEWAMCVACDMPFVSPAIMAWLGQLALDEHGIQAVVPMVQGRLQPFHALYHVRFAPRLTAAAVAGNLRIGDALANANVLWVEEFRICRELKLDLETCRRAFWNVNTPEDWAQALRWFAEDSL